MRIREEEMRMGLKMISEILNVPAFPRKHRQVLEILPGLPRRHSSRRHIAQFRVVHICKLESNLSLLRFFPIRHKNNHVSLQTLYNHIRLHLFSSLCPSRSAPQQMYYPQLFSPYLPLLFYRFCVSNKRLCNVWVVSYNARSDT